MIRVLIYALFFISSTAAIPGPGIVYSGVLYNTQNSPIQCTVSWATFAGPVATQDVVTVDGGKYAIVHERDINMGTWVSSGFIQEITCGNLVLTAPFPKVIKIERRWEFRIESNQIVSFGPSTYVP